MKLFAAGVTNVGMKRAHNEDNHILVPEQNLFVVADGMGGHAAGEVASLMAVQTVMREVNDLKEIDDSGKAATKLSDALRTANRNIHDRMLAESEHQRFSAAMEQVRTLVLLGDWSIWLPNAGQVVRPPWRRPQ